ncbi:MAG: L,D-transpeptidase/peptidoglycan binding protein [Solirubrobacteraceae bacterium]|nr:L,D-transpeptidase/peptidoglycan binding protein [Solirubrobacteraceae bacterium]
MHTRVFAAVRAYACAPAFLLLAAGAVPATALAAQTATPTPAATTPSPTTTFAPGTIQSGVKVGGIDVGGLSTADAAARLDGAKAQLGRDVVVLVGAHRYTLSSGQSLFTVDPVGSANAAVKASANAAVKPVVKYSYDNVRAFASKIAAKEYRKPVDARIAIKVDKIQVAPHTVGRRLDVNALAKSITVVLKDPALPRNLTPKRLAVKAAVTKGTLKKQYWTILTVNRSTFKLRVFKGLKLSKTYPIAVGAAGHDTPSGLYTISNKAVNPVWHVPNSAWAGSLAGTTVPGGAPNNPLKARWLGIVDGVGIHGTSEDWSIGSRASHGCLRMHVKDVIDLYPRVPVGTSVLIK